MSKQLLRMGIQQINGPGRPSGKPRYAPSSEKVGEHVPRVPTKLCPWCW